MSRYLMFQSRDPFEHRSVERDYDLARDLAARGDEVTVFLVENGVLATRRAAWPGGLERAAAAGVRVLADEFSLRERGIAPGELAGAVRPAPLEEAFDRLAAGDKAVWH